MSSSTGKTSPCLSHTAVLSFSKPTFASSDVTVTGVSRVMERFMSSSKSTAKVMSLVMLAGGLTRSAFCSNRTAPVDASVAIAPLYEDAEAACAWTAAAAAAIHAARIRSFRAITGGNRGTESRQHRVSSRPQRSCRRRLLQRQLPQPELRILLQEIAQGPVVGEKGHRLVELVRAKAHSRRHDQARWVPEGRMGLDPAKEGPRCLFKARLRAVLAFQPVLHDLELQRADGREKGRPRGSRPGGQRLDDALLQELLQARPEFLGVGRIGVRYEGEHLRREPRDLVEQDRAVLRQRVPDPEGVVAHETDDVAGPRLVHRLAVLPEELVRGGQAHGPARLRVQDRHVAVKFARADAQEGDPVAVPDRKSTRLNSSHRCISYAVFCLKKKKHKSTPMRSHPSMLCHPHSSIA